MRKDNFLIGSTKTLGTYALTMDTIKPKISAVNFKEGQWLSKYRYLKIKIDELDKLVNDIPNIKPTSKYAKIFFIKN